MILFPNAKINLGLNIVEKRPDGYHNLETVFYPIPLKDALEVVKAEPATGQTTLSVSGIQIDANPADNLVMKAYDLLKKAYSLPPVDIFLYKHIPFGAGIGGGSADASFMLKLLNDKFGLNLSTFELERYAVQLGADCPFFIQNKPMYAEGIGDLFSPVDLSLKGYRFVLIKPDIHVSTRDAFSTIKPIRPHHQLKEVIKKPIEQWKEYITNDFEKSVFPLFPAIAEVKQELYNKGALYASMSGSGSSVFGIFPIGSPEVLLDNNGMFSFQCMLEV
ncbi:4-(cytidine 5'-diphospho)-2-C-methyl-D-erythritol kinase [Bacteroides sp. 214]|uniref:4-(cytidine 5'-diphospho)-2-C-methyl-D-erythritol kinase n=1 Tax=Bacteroides sp. 214 TaxID=2302935 RepID=UPI0013D7D7AF|nr:4-(cytidine 5'-diphospho)-2-C-methyl-D-erythritol kinase [Bacteroides sp. 214]NDW12785.1 4-(cytidine 5'-diphospho)-2-C-methyl-D-erythritol kinase [Bacteroides sp. 214]